MTVADALPNHLQFPSQLNLAVFRRRAFSAAVVSLCFAAVLVVVTPLSPKLVRVAARKLVMAAGWR
jgi:hypothetical protein